MTGILPFAPGADKPVRPPAGPPAFFELVSTSNFSFLRSGSHPEELVAMAAALGLAGIGLCDRNSFAGVVRGYVARRDLEQMPDGFRYLVGTRLVFADGGPDIVAYPADRAGYGRLCKLLTKANAAGEKGEPRLLFTDLVGADRPQGNVVSFSKRPHVPPPGFVARDDGGEDGPMPAEGGTDDSGEDYAEGQLFILMPDERDWACTEAALRRLVGKAPGRVWVAGSARFSGGDRARLARIAELGRRHGAPMLASNDVLYHEPARRMVLDVVTCIREHLTLGTAGRRLTRNAERHLKSPLEMARLFREHPEALGETIRFAERVSFSLDQLKYNYPEETVGNGETAQQTLERLTWAGAARRYPQGLSDKLKASLWAELCLIAYKGYAAYFLTVHDIVMYARHEKKILCQGRGSAANSSVCFCLEITEVDPELRTLVFGRFISTERDEPPDIDVDFEHERREEVMAYIYAKYGGKRTGLTANVISYRSKSAIRESAKVFGISDDIVAALNQMHWGWGARLDLGGVRELGLDPDDPVLAQMFEVVKVLRGFPRHLSQHVGGFVITRDSLESLVPIGKSAMETRAIIEWNKDDIDALGILKVDILALGMLTCLRRAFALLETHYGRQVTIADLMAEEGDAAAKAPVYAMTQRADTIGVFQIESRAQMSMLPRLKPKEFYDLVIEVAIVRPGPIQGDMVHPYLRRRMGLEPVRFPSKALENVLGRTLGIPLFQEQAMQIAIVGAGFSAGKADQLRRAMAAWRRTGRIAQFGEEFIAGMLHNGYTAEFAKQCFAQIQGFAEYGFPESHAASFALLVYASCWLKCHYPDVFAAALLNSQPMGFYAPAQIIRDAREHGVEVRPVDINFSQVDHGLEAADPDWSPAAETWPRHREMLPHIWSRKALRLGFLAIGGLKKEAMETIVSRRGAGYDSVRHLWQRTGLAPAVLEKLAYADGFGSLGLNRRDALWAVKGLTGTHGADTLPLFAAAGPAPDTADSGADLPPMLPGEEVVHDYRSLSFSLKAHPVAFLRPMLAQRRIVPSEALASAPVGRPIEVAGLVLVRQRPGTASGVIFATLEDETGVANVIIWPKVFETNRRVVLGARLMAVRGQLQREGLVIHVVAASFTDYTPDLLKLADGRDIGDAVLARADEGRSGSPPGRDRQLQLQIETARRMAHAALPSGRNFH